MHLHFVLDLNYCAKLLFFSLGTYCNSSINRSSIFHSAPGILIDISSTEGLRFFLDKPIAHWVFPKKKLYPPVEDINFLKLIPWISSQFYHDPPGIFHFFALTPLEFLVFPSNSDILPPPLEFQLLSLYPLEAFIDILNRGFQFFLDKSIAYYIPPTRSFHFLC